MPKYLLEASYTTEGIEGLLREGGSGRQAAVQTMAEALGGKLDYQGTATPSVGGVGRCGTQGPV